MIVKLPSGKYLAVTDAWGPEDDIQFQLDNPVGRVTGEDYRYVETYCQEQLYEFWWQCRVAAVDFLD